MTKGAYFLGIETKRFLLLAGASFGSARLAPGFYLYCGSAYGPGGMEARLNRHLKRHKKQRWHVDQLTTQGKVRLVGRVPEGQECDLVSQFSALSGSAFPVPGFGSSDCKTCPSHLLLVDEGRLRPYLAEMALVEYF